MAIEERHRRWILFGVGAGAFASLLALEIITETEAASLTDLAIDAIHILLTITASVGVALLVQRVQKQHEEKLELLKDLDIARVEGDHWRARVQSHVDGLKAGLDAQFRDWGLTSAEGEVGLLILKGLNHKEIATVRETSEATVRQQAQAIYRKADLPGKTAFSAFFLEDLLPPEAMLRNTPAASAASHRERI
jgi:DNA-binding NarL/FixJ family response regulator